MSDLIKTKFVGSPIPVNGVRGRSVDAICRSVREKKKLALVVAPTGYGKSTTIAQSMAELEASGVACCWLSLDKEDNDPNRFLRYLIAAFQMRDPAVGASAAARMSAGGNLSVEAVLTALVNDVDAFGKPFVCFLDDYYFIDDAVVNSIMHWLVTYSPENLAFVVASRQLFDVAVSRLRMRRQLTLVTTENLSFSRTETGEFLTRSRGLALSDAAIAAIAEHTEGWVAGLQFASLILDSAENPEREIERFGGGDRDVADFLAETVLSHQPPELRDFLLQTSVLDRFNADWCAAVTGSGRSQALLDEIERKGLFLIPLDRERGWYRYHHLFGEFLKSRFAANDAAGMADAYRAAADFARRSGAHHDAIRYALAGKFFDEAASLIAERAASLLHNEGDHVTLLNWVRQLPAECLDRWPQVRLDYAWSLAFSSRSEDSDQQLRLVEKWIRQDGRGWPDADRALIAARLTMMRCVVAGGHDDTAQSRLLSAQWLRERPVDDPLWNGVVNCSLAHATLSTFEFDLGQSACFNARQLAKECGAHYMGAWTYILSGMLSMEQGELQLAIRSYREGLAYSNASMGAASYTSRILSATLAEALYEADQTEEARRLLADSCPQASREGSVNEIMWACYTVIARLAAMDGDEDGVLRTLAMAEESAIESGLPRLRVLSLAAQAQFHLMRDDVAAAVRVAETGGFLSLEDKLFGVDQRVVTQEVRRRATAEIDCKRGKVNGAIRVINDLVAEARQSGRRRKLLDLLIFRSRALLYQKGKSEALRSLAEALELAAAGGFVRIFVEQGDDILEMLDALKAAKGGLSREAEGLLTRVQAAARKHGADGQRGGPARPRSASVHLVESLTKREARILELLSAGSSNREIAEMTFISEQTVKWHLHNIFSKLGVDNRTRAVAVARELGAGAWEEPAGLPRRNR